MKDNLCKSLKNALIAFAVIFGFNMITTVPTSPEQVIPSIVVSAAAAVVILVVGALYWHRKDRKNGEE
ncbi:hypothetical protein [Saccharothrix sp. ALI-22-I]|uniref:hypothetical protein n=1 Tax=Saccharothrix sp. ALI-22-I TaxID=1933778 RepID=UPI00097C7B7C|nr:hypothetical protein [Saccharothrix sp. ALI-22-I]